MRVRVRERERERERERANEHNIVMEREIKTYLIAILMDNS